MIYHRPKQHYIWQQTDWPNFTWNHELVTPTLVSVKSHISRLLGALSTLGFDSIASTTLDTLTRDIVDSSQIEGEVLNVHSVRSSIARRLGIQLSSDTPVDHHTEGIVQASLDAQQHYDLPLTDQRLFGWHAALFPTGYSGPYHITVGAWRTGEDPMLIVSGAAGHEKIHYEAPPSSQVPAEMQRFFNRIDSDTATDSLLLAAIAHLWFVSIHPFDDGNGRIARTLTDLLLCRSDRTAYRCYSVNTQLLRHRNQYYDILQRTTCSGTDISEWLLWFLARVDEAIDEAEQVIASVINKKRFFDTFDDTSFNLRQQKILHLLFDHFEGNLTTSKWAKICHCSSDTALRDINELVTRGILVKAPAGGRSTNYILAKKTLRNTGETTVKNF